LSVRPMSAAAVCVLSVLSCAVVAAPAGAQFASTPGFGAPATGGAVGQPSGPVSQQPVIRQIAVEGNQRIEPETVRAYMVLKEGDQFDPARIDSSLKSLFATGLFADVSIGRSGDTLVVKVVENPIINRIAFEGNKRIEDTVLESEVQLRARQVYTRAKVQADVTRILDVYRRSGRYAVTVEPKIIELEQNRVDLAFEINEGPPTYIRRINFVGNEKFSDGRLREEIATREERWYRFFSSVDTYDPDRLTFDRELLRRHYLRQGYSDFRVVSAVAELTSDRSGFYVTFTLDEGERYRFGEVDVEIALPDVTPEVLRPLITVVPGEWYNADEVEDSVQAITNALGEMGYAFVDVRPRVNRDRDNRVIGIVFEVQEGPRVYVERIDITGNVRTLDRVIRREFRLVEGDAFNTAKLRRSQQRIRNLGFFEDVQVTNAPSETAPDRTVVQVDVQERSTGELSFGVGWSSGMGALFDISLRERNLLGRGQDLRSKLTLAQRRQEIDLSFTEPYFLDRPLAAGFDLFHTRTDLQDESSYDTRETGAALRLGFNYTDRLTQGLKYTVSRTSIENVPPGAAQAIIDSLGTTTVSMVSQTLTYDRRDSTIDPREGYFARLSNDVAGLGGSERFLRTTIDGGQYFPVTDNITLALQGTAGIVAGLGKDVRFNRNYYLGGDTLRGFEYGGASPRDVATGDVLGGKWMAAASAELRFPLGLPQELGLTGKAFTDVGMIGSPDGTNRYNIHTSTAPRASVGVGLVWVSPMGPVSIDLAQALLKEDWDRTEFFRFNFGTRF